MSYIYVKNKGEVRRGLVLNQPKWNKLQDTITTKQRQEKQAAENAKYIQDRKDLSAKMQSEWDNTIMNKRKKRFEEMEAKQAMAEAEREKKYWQLRREEQELREQINSKAKYILSQEKDCNKNINRALLLAETLRERKAQVEFVNSVRQEELERQIKYANSIKEDAKKFEDEEKQAKELQLQKKHQEHAEKLKMLQEIQEERLATFLKEKSEGEEERKRLQKEIKEEEEKELIEKNRRRELAIIYIEENAKIKEDHQRKVDKQNEEDDMRIRIVSEAKKRLNNERKKREKEYQAASILQREKIANQVAALIDCKDTMEDELVARYTAENNARLEKREKDDIEHKERMKQQNIQAYQDFQKEEEQKRLAEFELRKWYMMQRFKKDELIKKYEQNLAAKQYETTKKCRVTWNDQIRERRAREQKEVEEDVDALNRANEVWKNEDQEFMKYAQEMLAECQRVGRPTYPIEAILKEYKKSIGDMPKRPLSATWRSNVPIFNPAVEEEAERRQIDRPKIRPKCACVPRNGISN